MNEILLIAPTTQAVSVPVVLDLRQHSGATVKSVFNEMSGNRVRILMLIGGDLRQVAEISAASPIARIPGGDIYCVTKDSTPEAAGVFITLGAYGNAQQPTSGGSAVEWPAP